MRSVNFLFAQKLATAAIDMLIQPILASRAALFAVGNWRTSIPVMGSFLHLSNTST